MISPFYYIIIEDGETYFSPQSTRQKSLIHRFIALSHVSRPISREQREWQVSPLQHAGRQPSQTTTSSLSSRWLPLPTRDTHSEPADIVNFLSQEFPIDPYLPYHLARTRSVRRVPRSARVSSPLHWPIYPIVGQPHCFRVLLCALSTPKKGWLVPERSIESQVVQIPSWPHRDRSNFFLSRKEFNHTVPGFDIMSCFVSRGRVIIERKVVKGMVD